MATNMPRVNTYQKQETVQWLQSKKISVSKLIRDIIEFYITLEKSPEFKAAENLAAEKGVEISYVIIAALRKTVNDKYYN